MEINSFKKWVWVMQRNVFINSFTIKIKVMTQ